MVRKRIYKNIEAKMVQNRHQKGVTKTKRRKLK